MSTDAIVSDLRSNSWAQGTVGEGAASMGCNGIPGFVGFLVQHVAPLQDWVNDLLGDPGTVGMFASGWQDTERELRNTTQMLRASQATLGDIDGRSARALRERYEDIIDFSEQAAEWTGATAAAIRLVSRIIEATRTFICEFLGKLANFAHELFGFEINPVTKIRDIERFANSSFEFVSAAGQLVKDLTSAVVALAALLTKLQPMIDELKRQLRNALVELLPYVGAIAGAAIGASLGLSKGGLLGGIGGGALGGALGWMLGNAGMDFLREDAEMTEIDPATLTDKQRDAWEKAQGVTEFTSMSDLVSVNGTTDGMGGENATAIDIKEVLAPDGTTHYVVSLPSTQAWEFGGEAGAMNDRDNNLALMLDNPVFRTQYERAVLQAMSEAGVPAGADVVLTGFSQGGIMAANLASDSSFPYNPIGVVTNGSPIETFDVPAHVPVYAFQHESDVVPKTDDLISGPTSPNVQQVTLPDPEGENFMGVHDNRHYTNSVAAWEDGNEAVAQDMQLFGGTVVNHQIYSGVEKP